jgi:heme a synthase
MIRSEYNPALHRTALLTAAATFPLIFMGGLVTSHQAGLSVPDWPNSWGYNMFLFPPRLWIGGILYEHTHRLMGTVVGMLSILLTVVAWITEKRLWVRWLATGVLGAVIFQGILGGLRVVLLKLDLAIVHACVAQAFFCLAALTAIVTSKWWIEAPDLSNVVDRRSARRLIGVSIACVFAIYAQLIVGATMRHYEAGLAIPDLPLAYGKLLPPTRATGLRAVNNARIWQVKLSVVTLPQIWLAFAHRIGALLVSAIILWTAFVVLRHHRRQRELVILAISLLALLVIQIALGVVTVLWRKPADVASAHVAVGALALVAAFVLSVRALRVYAPRRDVVRRGFEILTPSNRLAAAI